jgi:hypothetical protein
MNEALRARLAEIDAQPAENLTRGAAASLAAAEAMDDGTAENINDYIARKTKTTKAQQAAVLFGFIQLGSFRLFVSLAVTVL